MSGNLKKSIIEIAHEFKEMEVRNNLFQQQTKDGIYYWDIFRYNVYMTILSENGIFENVKSFLQGPNESFVKRYLKSIKLLPLFLLNELRYLFLLKKKHKIVFLLNSRFQDREGNPCDLLMEDIYSHLCNEAFEFEIFRHRGFGWLKRNIGKRYFLYKLEIDYLIGPSVKYDWTSLADLINREFSVSISWHEMFHTLINKYRKEYKFFRKVLKRIDPEFLFFQTHPKGMIAAARDLGIVTLDLQHGHTNNVGVLYSYPKEVDLSHVSSIPEIFLTLGNFWNNLVDFPNKVVAVGNCYFSIQPSKFVSNNKGIMIVSSSFTHDLLQYTTAQLAKNHREVTFYYKLHSNQKHQEDSCKSFFSQYLNVKVVYTEESVKDIMERCFAIIVVQSSVIYQALQKGLKVFIIKRDYYEVSYDIFNAEGVCLVDDWRELSTKLAINDGSCRSNTPVFFEKYKPEVIDAIVTHMPLNGISVN